eukprot:NODE_15524_length_1046_cov_2.658324.p1 GENE.NODE_15524_length_1046_cov_2.658324~~NODE_15524_length_1046_cov_2.658324.p1  ORF type:complete len:314 (+),score=80.27 NODE_15524_length_1046_cov_2.658324:3-944(+)
MQLGLLNLIVGIIVDAIETSRDTDHLHKFQEKLASTDQAKAKLMQVCKELDTDGSGELTIDEVLDAFDNHDEFNRALTLMDIRKDELTGLFAMMDVDHSGTVDFEEFVEQLHHIKEQDSHTMLIFIKHHLAVVRQALTSQLKVLEEEILNQSSARDDKIAAILAAVCPNGDSNILVPVDAVFDSFDDVQSIKEVESDVRHSGGVEMPLQSNVVECLASPRWRKPPLEPVPAERPPSTDGEGASRTLSTRHLPSPPSPPHSSSWGPLPAKAETMLPIGHCADAVCGQNPVGGVAPNGLPTQFDATSAERSAAHH